MKETVEQYVGTQFRHNGRSPDGLDCIGLVICFLRDNGIQLPDNDDQEIEWHWYRQDYRRMIRGLEQYGERINIADRQPLDIIVFRINTAPRHAGVLIGRNRFLHIRQGKTATVERLSKWKRLYHSAYRIGGETRWESGQ